MADILKTDLEQITYREYGEILEKLTSKLKNDLGNQNKRIDLVVPILRSGAFTGLHIASKLKITNILPAQYKYRYGVKTSIEKKFDLPQLHYDVPENPLILIVDTNTVGGDIADLVISDIKKRYAVSELWYASAVLDCSKNKFDNVDHIIFGQQSNEKRELTKTEADRVGVTSKILIFPWENLEEQWQEISGTVNPER